jgi:hypothetical protein
MHLKNVSNEDLIAKTECEIRSERESTHKIIKLFLEIYDRKLHLARGFPSFYEMATKHFGYCAGSAMRRINAMKLVREMPQFEKQIESGELSLSVAADVQSFFYQEAKIERLYSLNAKIELVESCVGKSRKEAEHEFARRSPEREKRESINAISHDRLRVSFTISKELSDKLNRLKDLLAHVDPNMTTEHLLERLSDLGLEKYDPQRKAARAKARRVRTKVAGETSKQFEQGSETQVPPTFEHSTIEQVALGAHAPATSSADEQMTCLEIGPVTSAAEVNRSRYIPASEKQSVSDDGGCTFTDAATGRRCGSTKLLQFDHIQPYSQGGSHRATNLRRMCAQHNRYRWESRNSCAR